MRTWVLASSPGIAHYSRISPRDFCVPGIYKVQHFPTISHNCIILRSRRNFLFPLSYCSRGISRRKMLSTGEMAEKALGGRFYVGGLHKQVLDITHRSLLPSRAKETGHVTVCFKDDDYHNGSPVVNSVTCTTYNILAPIYKRINSEGIRESEYREYWFSRNKSILEILLQKRSSIICLQEFWIKNEELVDMYEKRFHDAGYDIYKLGRTNDRGDGLLTAVRRDHFKVVNNQELLFNDFGDRVAQLLHLRSALPYIQNETDEICLEAIIVNTHLLFPHNSNYSLVRLRQVYKILEYLEIFKADNKLQSIPVILCGDWNGSKRGHVYKFLRSQGFVSSYDTARDYTDGDQDAHRWISHLNHRGNKCGVDFIWLLNPDKDRKPLNISWMQAVFSIIKFKLKEAGLNNLDAFCFFNPECNIKDYFTLEDFRHALQQLGLTEQLSEGLTSEEIEDLMMAADLDGNGIIDSEEFQKVMITQSIELSPITVLEGKKYSAPYVNGKNESPLTEQHYDLRTVNHNKHLFLRQITGLESGSPLMKCDVDPSIQDQDALHESEIGFDVKGASLFPSEVEQGIWPENYHMSDHALLSAVFEPVRIPKKQKASG
ncbi:hypothetical protein SUGI_0898380 [Cryptomeria japonica]|uniref:uncharacterized calcium-binding protein At1g02270 isoform X2 n=1 Tax=Cryptomeria japonica TaxID=3369 RepID=UPI0024148334|nr:uncharacterized calcium-binding protein At1g02270 isoform X2 [Cryptomeria japonica]GLJ43270.1 hypothetical protein SUGI_0898380 [Cryptomeria japonica]